MSSIYGFAETFKSESQRKRTICPYFDECQPEVTRNCCHHGGIWQDRRRKNFGKYCFLFLEIDAVKPTSKIHGVEVSE